MPIRPINPNKPSRATEPRVPQVIAGTARTDFDPPPVRRRRPKIDELPPARRRRKIGEVPPSQKPAARSPSSKSRPSRSRQKLAADPQPAADKPEKKKTQRRGHAVRGPDGKYQPTGDYPSGFARTPPHTRFDGSQKGPGRPKGSRSQDSYWREELDAKVSLTENGVHRKYKKRQLAPKLLMKNALERRDDKALHKVDEVARRLFPEHVPEAGATPAALGDARFDKQLIEQFMAGLSLGEARGEGGGAAMDFAFSLASASGDGGSSERAGWSEGDWSAPGAAMEADDGDEGGSAQDEEACDA